MSPPLVFVIELVVSFLRNIPRYSHQRGVVWIWTGKGEGIFIAFVVAICVGGIVKVKVDKLCR